MTKKKIVLKKSTTKENVITPENLSQEQTITGISTGNKVEDEVVERPFDDGTGRKMFIIASADVTYDGPQYDEEEIIPNPEQYDGLIGADGSFIPTPKVLNEEKDTTSPNVSAETPENTTTQNSEVENSSPIIAGAPETLAENKQADKGDIANIEPAVKIKRVSIVGTTYHYYRRTLKKLLKSNEITTAKFIKEPVGYKGNISIAETDQELALQVLTKYKSDNPEAKELWWNTNTN